MGWKERLKPAIVHACQMLRIVTAGLARPATQLRQDLSALVGNAEASTILSNLSGTSGNLASLGPLIGTGTGGEGPAQPRSLSGALWAPRTARNGAVYSWGRRRPGLVRKTDWRNLPRRRWMWKRSWQTNALNKLPPGPASKPASLRKSVAARRRLETSRDSGQKP